MSSAIGPVFTYLLTKFTATMQALDPASVVVDGPVALEIPPPPALMVYVGAEPETGLTVEGTRTDVELGNFHAEESFTIPCYIEAMVGGDDQSACRNLALGAYNALVRAIHADRTLGGALVSGRVANVINIQIRQTETDEESDVGRLCLITFAVSCENTYTP